MTPDIQVGAQVGTFKLHQDTAVRWSHVPLDVGIAINGEASIDGHFAQTKSSVLFF